jgi:hypothetical protein
VFTKSHPLILAAVVSALALAPAIARAEEPPPKAYSNFKALTETHATIVAHGTIQLHSSALGHIECENTFFAEGWNAHEHGESSKPLRGYGEVLGWGTSQCTAPEEIASIEARKNFIKEEHIPTPITVLASAEPPIEFSGVRQGEICKEESKSLQACSATTEREVKELTEIGGFHRRVSSLPWKVELIRGERDGEEGTLQKIGLHEFGESGTAREHTTKCYPTEVFLEMTVPALFEKVPSGCILVDIIFPQVPYEFTFYGTQEIWGVNGAGNGLDPSRLKFLESGTLFSPREGEGFGETTGQVTILGAEGLQLIQAH